MNLRHLASAVCLALAVLIVARPASGKNAATDGQHLQGSWLVDATVEGQPPLKGLITFTRDGALVETVFLPFVSPGHGAWVRTGNGTFAITNIYFVSDPTGQLLRIGTVRASFTLDSTLNAANVVFHVDLSDPVGNPLSAFEGTGQATRILAEP